MAMPPSVLSRVDVLEWQLRELRAEAQAAQGAHLPALVTPCSSPPRGANSASQVEESHKELLTAHRELLQMLSSQTQGQSTLAKQHHELLTAHNELLQKLSRPEAEKCPEKPSEAKGGSRPTARLQKAKTRYLISNDQGMVPPSEPTLLDNTLLFLPQRAVQDLNLEANMDDKGDTQKSLWFGRVWELRALLECLTQDKITRSKEEQESLSEFRKREIKIKLKDPSVRLKLKKIAAHWRGAAFRSRCSFSVLERLKYSYLRGTLIYAHGSGGCSWDNFRICRMIAAMGILVIAPDGFAYPKSTAMGEMRHKSLAPLHKASDDVDYWANDLLYTSSACGTFNYSTSADSVLKEPQDYKELYEKCYQLRRSELHFTIARLPRWVLSQGFFLGGTSEGAMTVARFDDQRYGEMVIGRFINSFSIEYCYFTPEREAGLIGGQLDVPTLNIIGTKDQYFGPVESVAKVVAVNGVTGYGDKNLTGNGYKTMVRQGLDIGLVCVLEDGVHSPCETHDNFLRQLFNTFFSRTGSIWELHMIWQADPTMAALVELVATTASGDGTEGKNVTQLFVPKMKFPNHMTLREVELLRALHHTDEIAAAMEVEKTLMDTKMKEIKEQLDRARQEAATQRNRHIKLKSTKYYYARDKLAIKCKWIQWVQRHT